MVDVPPPALSPVLLVRRYAPCRPVANASVSPRTCHAFCVLLRSTSYVGYAQAAPGPAVSSVRPATQFSLRRSTALRSRSRRGGRLRLTPFSPPWFSPLDPPFRGAPFRRGIPPGGKPIQGTTAQASFCLELPALRVGAATPPLSQAPQPPGKSLFRPFYELSPELHSSCFGGVECRTFTARLRRTRSLTGKEKPEFPRRSFRLPSSGETNGGEHRLSQSD